MPSSVDPARLLRLGDDLEALGAVSRGGAEQALGHFPEVGDRAAQNALDALLEQLADTLRAIDAEASELAGRLRIAATSTAESAGSAAQGSAPHGSAPHGSAPHGSATLGSATLGSATLGSATLGSDGAASPTGGATRPSPKGMFR